MMARTNCPKLTPISRLPARWGWRPCPYIVYAARFLHKPAHQLAGLPRLQLQEQMEDAIAEGMAQEAASISLAIQECAAELETAAIEELAAESRLLLLLLRLMDFPAQQGALYVASWPFFPQVGVAGWVGCIDVGKGK